MVPNQRADSSASLSLRPLRSLRLNGARFNSLEADPDGTDLGAVIEKNSRGLLSPEERGSPKAEGRRSKQIRTALGLGLRALGFGLWTLDFGLFRDANGRQVWRGTGLRERESALVLAKEWEADAKRKRAEQGAVRPKVTIRVRPSSAERQQGCLTQAEVAAILRISERAVREIERRAIDKLRRHPDLKNFWREWQTGRVAEALSRTASDYALGRSEIAAVYALALTPVERQALQKFVTGRIKTSC